MMRGYLVIALGLLISLSSIYDSIDGVFTMHFKSGSGHTIYRTGDYWDFYMPVAGQALLGLFAVFLGLLILKKKKS